MAPGFNFLILYSYLYLVLASGMSVGDVDATIKKLYRRLFYLPGVGVLLGVYVVEWLILFIVAGSRIGFSRSFTSTLAGAFIYLALIYLVFRYIDRAVDSFKKSVGIAVMSLAPYIVSEVVGFRDKIYVSIAGSSAMIFLVHFIFRGGVVRSFIWALVIGFTTYMVALLMLFPPSLGMIYSFGINALAALSPILLFVVVLELGGRLNGIRTFELARSFLRSWLFDDFVNLERAFERYSIRRDIAVRFSIVRRVGGRDIVLVFPGFHFGPFKRVGSSDAVHVFDDVLGSDFHVFTFHTLGSHDMNIVSRSYVLSFARDLKAYIDSLGSRDHGFEPVRGPIRVSSDSWRAFVFGSSSCSMVFLSNRFGSDDLPLEIGDFKAASYPRVLIADSHNKIERIKIGERDVRFISSVISMGVSSLANLFESPSGSDTAMVGYGEATVGGVCIGLCKRLVKVLVFSDGSRKSALIYIYGNNIDKSTHDRLVAHIRDSRGYSDVELVTPDDHSCAATSLGTPYTAVHMCRSLVSAIDRALDQAEKDLKPSKLACFERVYRDVPVMGSNIWKMVKGIEILGPITPRLWIITLAVSIALNAIV